jgi:4,4'-diaponeurosporenoate glycosyltransferase
VGYLAVWSAAYLLFAAQLYWMLVRLGNFHWTTALAYPVPLVYFVYVFLRSQLAARLRGQVSWKGRTIDT